MPGTYFDALIPLGNWAFPSIREGATDVDVRPAARVDRVDDIDIIRSGNGVAMAVFWIDVFVPTGTAGGSYKTDVVLTAGCGSAEVEPTTVEIRFEVANFAIPSTSSLPSMFEWYMDGACDATFPDRGGNCFEADKEPVSDLYGRFMLEHRLTLRLDPGNRPNAPSYVQFMAPFVNGDDADMFYNQKLLPGATVTTITFPWNQLADDPEERAAGMIAMETDMADWLSALQAEQRPDGASWDTLAIHKVGDEPPGNAAWTGVGSVQDQAEVAHQLGVPTLVTADITHLYQSSPDSDANGQPDLLDPRILDILVANVVRLDNADASSPYYGDQRANYTDLTQDGGAVWSYQSCMSHGCQCAQGAQTCLPDGAECSESDTSCTDELGERDDQVAWPTLTIDTWGIQNRAEPWLSFIYSYESQGNPPATPFLRGLHYYDITGWGGIATDPAPGSSPYRASSLYRHGGNGDGQLVYPGNATHLGGTHNFPVASFRLKQLREGLEEYEWLLKCRENDEARSLAIAKTVFPMEQTDDDPITGNMYNSRKGVADEFLAAERLRAQRIELWRCVTGADPAVTDPSFEFGG